MSPLPKEREVRSDLSSGKGNLGTAQETKVPPSIQKCGKSRVGKQKVCNDSSVEQVRLWGAGQEEMVNFLFGGGVLCVVLTLHG